MDKYLLQHPVILRKTFEKDVVTLQVEDDKIAIYVDNLILWLRRHDTISFSLPEPRNRYRLNISVRSMWYLRDARH